VLQVVSVGCQRVRRELPIPKMIQEPADRSHRLAVITDQPYPADDATIPLLDDPHPSLLASCQQQHGQRMRPRMINGKESRKIPQQVVQIRMYTAPYSFALPTWPGSGGEFVQPLAQAVIVRGVWLRMFGCPDGLVAEYADAGPETAEQSRAA